MEGRQFGAEACKLELLAAHRLSTIGTVTIGRTLADSMVTVERQLHLPLRVAPVR